ncbi:ATP-binding cassette domain-containing protein [Pedobacter yulinensis]|nr:ATP-binding cassette domain-containing protein [Pedobacter yulinensis]
MQTLTADSITKSFGSRQVLNGVYLSCQTGRVTGLLGRNGSGKSTLLKIVYGIEPASFQHVRINGRHYNRPYRSGLLHLLSQNYEIPAQLHTGSFIGISCFKYREVLSALPFVKDRLNMGIHTLSGGERRFLFVLAAIYSDAPFVLLDEPFANLSPLLAEEAMQHIKAMKAHKAFVLTDHRYAQLISCSDDLILLHNNSNYTIRAPEELVRYGYLPQGAFIPESESFPSPL